MSLHFVGKPLQDFYDLQICSLAPLTHFATLLGNEGGEENIY